MLPLLLSIALQSLPVRAGDVDPAPTELPRPAEAAGIGDTDAQAILLIEALRLPPSALADFVEHPDAETRARAARALGRLRDAGALAGLRRLADDPVVEVRAEVAFALGQTPGGAPLALDRLPDEPDPAVRSRLLEALGKQGDAAVVPALLGALRTPGASPESAAAARAVGRLAMRDVPGAKETVVTEALLDVLQRLDPATRQGAAFALARGGVTVLPAHRARELRRRAGADWDPVVRAFLVRAAAGLDQAPEDLDQLLQRAARDEAAGVRVAAARAAARTGWGGVDALLADPDRGVRREAITAVGAVPALDARALLQPIVDAGATQEADEAMQTRGDPRLIEAATALQALGARGELDDPAPYLALSMPTRIRAAAVDGVTDLDQLVTLASQDGERLVRTAAALALVQREPQPEQLVPLLDAFDPIVAAVAAEHLTTNPAPRVEEPLRGALLQSDEPELLRAAAEALAARYEGHPNPPLRHDTELRAQLERLASHPDASVRAAVANLAATLGVETHPSMHGLHSVDLDLVRSIQGARVFTNRGEIRIDLLPEEAPLTVWNFAWLADQGFYDRLVLHRVVADFVVQDGDPRGDGFGGPGWTIPDEINPVPYDEGVVGMALAGPDTGGSQWFVTLSPQPHLDGSYTVFGRITDGLGLLRLMQPGDRILRVEIERDRD
ncbi:MAG: peptidylprolyl isomerase [Alphaproteobacteria bacterium]|nr:peptidylprolyl isomerase [Alphaproteobacteria bacterium]